MQIKANNDFDVSRFRQIATSITIYWKLKRRFRYYSLAEMVSELLIAIDGAD
jgi:hypothetical protein